MHQSELAQRQNVVPGAVCLHVFAHTLVEHLSVFGQVHVYEVDDNDAANISEPELACNLVGRTEVCFQCILLLPVFFLCARSAVHINHVHGLGVFDVEVCPVLIVHNFAESRFNLLCNIEAVEDGKFSCKELHDVGFFRSDERDVVFHFLIDFLIVHMNALVSWVEEVAQECDGSSRFFEDQLWPLLCSLHLDQCVLPSFGQDFQFCIEFGNSFALCNGSNDNAAVAGLDAVNKLFQSGAFFAAFDFRRNRNFIVERHQYQIAPCKRKFACEPWPLGGDGFFHNLHEHFLPNFQCCLHAAVFFQVGQAGGLGKWIKFLPVALYLFQILFIRAELSSQVKIVQKGIALKTNIYEAGIEPWHQFFNFCDVDVPNGERCRARLILVFHQFLVLEQGNRNLLLLDVNYKFACHFCFLTCLTNRLRASVGLLALMSVLT